MSDNIKLIIEIPKVPKNDHERWVLAHGMPLDSVKAEIKEKCDRINSIASVLRYPQHREIQELLCEILESIDKAESEDKE